LRLEGVKAMMGFISTNKGYLAPSTIRSWRFTKKEPGRNSDVEIKTHDGETYNAFSDELDVFSPVITAEPGWFILEYHEPKGEETESIWRTPIVAWRVHANYAAPISIDSFLALKLHHVILAPNGCVYGQEGEEYDSELAWMECRRAKSTKASLDAA
jgi:hypothetical protein